MKIQKAILQTLAFSCLALMGAFSQAHPSEDSPYTLIGVGAKIKFFKAINIPPNQTWVSFNYAVSEELTGTYSYFGKDPTCLLSLKISPTQYDRSWTGTLTVVGVEKIKRKYASGYRHYFAVKTDKGSLLNLYCYYSRPNYNIEERRDPSIEEMRKLFAEYAEIILAEPKKLKL